MVAGATDLGLLITKQLQTFDTLISVCEVQELKLLERDETANQLLIGAAVSYTDALETLADCYPGIRNLLLRLGAEQVRNAGTIGGNIANGSPIGDMPPALIALGASLVLSSGAGRREIPLENFFIDYGKQDLQAGECVESIKLPLPGPDQFFAAYKLSKRFDQDISSVCGAFSVTLKNQQVVDVRICFGGMAGTPLRARAAELALINQPWNAATVARARTALASDYTPLTDWRASSDYRRLAAQNLLQRFFLDSTTDGPVHLAGGIQT
jgi:xanthine dehydrogenase small subunit